jgi:uncharacterized protein (DUF58 family)
MNETPAPLFDERARRKLEQVMLAAPRVRAGAFKGERRSVKRGTSIEFADYRDYAPGDDLRRLDWNVYARLGRPLVKLFEDEEDLAVHVLLDTSASMSGAEQAQPEWDKFTYARRLAAALAYISLTSGDRLTVAPLGAAMQPFTGRGRAYGARLFQYMAALQTGGAVDLNAALRTYGLRLRRPGLCLIISDLFAEAGFTDGLTALQAKGCEVAVLHVLAPDELDPEMTGDLRLVDVETGAAQEVSLDSDLIERYRRRVRAWHDDMRALCARRGAHYLAIDTRDPWDRVILQEMRRLGIVR